MDQGTWASRIEIAFRAHFASESIYDKQSQEITWNRPYGMANIQVIDSSLLEQSSSWICKLLVSLKRRNNQCK
jgi:hypothetical protein